MRLKFKAEDLKRVVEHSLAAPEQRTIAYTQDKPNHAAVLLVHDHGVYLMSNGNPRDIARDIPADGVRGLSYLVYAEGCNPETDPDWYETARELVGGDDFAATLQWAAEIKEWIERPGIKKIYLNVTKRTITLAAGTR